MDSLPPIVPTVRSCCFELDRCFILGIISTLLVFSGCALSVFKLVTATECVETTPYYMLFSNMVSLAAGGLFANIGQTNHYNRVRN